MIPTALANRSAQTVRGELGACFPDAEIGVLRTQPAVSIRAASTPSSRRMLEQDQTGLAP